MRRTVAGAIVLVGLFFATLLIPGSAARAFVLGFLMRHSASAPVELPAEQPPSSGKPLRVAVGAMISPERTHLNYEKLFALLAEQVGRPVRLVQRKTYREVNELLEAGEVDVAWVCTGAWVDLHRRGIARLLAVPVVDGHSTYRAYLLAGPTTRALGLRDLRGGTFAFTDPDSLTGFLVPQRAISALGFDPKSFFGETFHTHAHDISIEAVRRGLADGASVDGLVYDFLARRFPRELQGIRILERSEPFPIPPLVIPVSLDESTATKLRSTIRSFHRLPAARAMLDEILVDRFDFPDEEAYARLWSGTTP